MKKKIVLLVLIFIILVGTTIYSKIIFENNIPILAYHIQTIDELGISVDKYGKWIQEFFTSYTLNPNCEYHNYCGQGATSKTKVMARLEYVDREIRKLVK